MVCLSAFSSFSVRNFTNMLSIFGFVLVVIGLILWVKRLNNARKPKTEGEKMANPYVIEHERKLIDDEIYQEYVDWCMFHGELPMEKKGFDEIRMKEWELRRKVEQAMK